MPSNSNSAERPHSRWGGSVAERFMHCPASVLGAEIGEDRMSIQAAEGTAGHQLGEWCLTSGDDAIAHLGERLVVGNHVFDVDEEFAEHVQLYLDAVRAEYHPELGDQLLVEEEFDLGTIHDGAYGRADAVIWQPRLNRLVVIDLKFGRGYIVEVKGNVQARYYALGALLKGNYPATDVTLMIVQPRASHADGPIRTETVSALHILDFAEELRVAIKATLDPNAEYHPGPWCTFCPKEATCEARREQSIRDAQAEFASPVDLEPDELAAILTKASEIASWIEAVRKNAFARMTAGEVVPGWKLVNKRAVRRWNEDESLVALAIANDTGVDEVGLWETKLRSPAQVEKLVPKWMKKQVGEHVVSVSSGVTIAPVADRRHAVLPPEGAASDFEDDLLEAA
jgi:hypothetical protein